MPTTDIVTRLRLARTRGIGPVGYRQLIARFGDAASAIEALPELTRRGGGRATTLATIDDVEREVEAVARLNGRHIIVGDADYPHLLEHTPSAPVALIVKGDARLLERPAVAMVGARNASAAACRFARMLARQIAETGHVVVSGLARGIDGAAHLGAIDHGTIAVIANGLDMVFPSENVALQDRIGEEQLLITEYPPGTEPLARHFPQRNRIIAGLAMGTIVVEAAPKSGSLLTARLAAEAGREVMAVPGSPLDPRAQGCNQLIRDGATLVQTLDDVLEALTPVGEGRVEQMRSGFSAQTVAETRWNDDLPTDASDDDRSTIIAMLGPVSVSVDELARQTGIAMPVIQMVLLELELAGRVQRHGNGQVSLDA